MNPAIRFLNRELPAGDSCGKYERSSNARARCAKKGIFSSATDSSVNERSRAPRVS